ncbi:MAG: InlB B-repeat-containing protein [Methanocorpusculum sp.]|nr:InlB B-repeat-containing protein [Methanocorpusculum sp.]MDE2525185.1 InlB B-repeat-containing protein [Methanocorpusculum sp.]
MNNTAAYGGGIRVTNSSTHTTDSGNVQIVGGVNIISGDAKITGNTATTSGGGIHVTQGTLTMTGGSISENTGAPKGGAGICLSQNATFEMSGGSITGNKGTDTYACFGGGGVSLDDGAKEMIMTGGTISGNSAGQGGGVLVDTGCLTMSDGTISGNSAEIGGGVMVGTSGVLNLSGAAKITDSSATTNGAGVYVEGKLGMSENANVSSEVYLTTGTFINIPKALAGNGGAKNITTAKESDGTVVIQVSDTATTAEHMRPFFALGSRMEPKITLQVEEPNLILKTPYTVTILDGVITGTTNTSESYFAGDTVWITANTSEEGKVFDKWVVTDGVATLDDPSSSATTFTMPAMSVTVTATYKDASGGGTPEPETPVPTPSGSSSSGDGNMENAFRVLFDTSGGSTIPPQTGLSYGDRVTKPADPVKDGCTFDGWYKDAGCTQAWSFSDSIPGDMTLYAKWNCEATTTPTPTATITPEPTGQPATPTPTGEQTSEPTGQPTSDTGTKPAGGILPLLGGILLLFLAILLLILLFLRHTVTFLIPSGGELSEYRIKVWHGRYINPDKLPELFRTAAWYRDPGRLERWDFNKDRVRKSIELYLG